MVRRSTADPTSPSRDDARRLSERSTTVFLPEPAQQGWAEILLADQRDDALELRRRGEVERILDRDQDDERLGMARVEPARDLDPVEPGHPHVEQHQLGGKTVDGAQRLLAGLRLPDGLESGRRIDHVARHAAESRLVVDGEDPHRHERVTQRHGAHTAALASRQRAVSAKITTTSITIMIADHTGYADRKPIWAMTFSETATTANQRAQPRPAATASPAKTRTAPQQSMITPQAVNSTSRRSSSRATTK